jgi:hypothetical protein
MLQVTFARKADYISAACVMFPRQLYMQIGGFDPAYGLGYYEDTDLAMAIRASGYHVVFQPLSVVCQHCHWLKYLDDALPRVAFCAIQSWGHRLLEHLSLRQLKLKLSVFSILYKSLLIFS